MLTRSTRTLTAIAAVAAIGLGGGVPVAMARHGADDPPGHNAGDDHGGARHHARAARHRADDPPGDDHGGRGRHGDDGPNHR